ncbi:odorant receptor 98a-like [Diabrotica undecimpunctata]|uniref:odorant receptor 98a-like n=1 Tax=Diabrotica undecimpunctata TaxID=50387 RepID=UPI003B63B469
MTGYQYYLLELCLGQINSKNMLEYNKSLRRHCQDKLEEIYKDELKEYFVRCVRHHQMLLRYTNTINKTLNPLELCQLAYSICAICFGILRITYLNDISPTEIIISIVYIIGFTMQLLIDCILGTILYNQASLLPDYIFSNNWENLENNILKKDIMFVLTHAQRIPQFNAYGLYDLNMMSFLKVIKVAFSFYTVLSAIGTRNSEI